MTAPFWAMSLWVMLGSALGGLGRYWLAIGVATLTGPRLPWGTFAINVLGSFVIGWFGALTGPAGRLAAPPELRVFVMVGLCGGFTTFSSFSLQTLEMLQAEDFGWAAAYVLGSVALCIAGAWGGYLLGH